MAERTSAEMALIFMPPTTSTTASRVATSERYAAVFSTSATTEMTIADEEDLAGWEPTECEILTFFSGE
ncbi:hypothetical protein A0H81_12923 [Grifola frondosa]|uniref:Uncharacterized protein n=1 Tax=Grifola frondosa TaxID=5627 RepID=A0A1C7LR16_GRIFR|nr:hypothetical protein A0H81_12923 [Grifola frondosa]